MSPAGQAAPGPAGQCAPANTSGAGSGPKPWVIVGGGLLGLTMAHTLAKRGRRVVVLEAGAVSGGLASGWTVGGFTWDRHYHVTLHSDTVTRGLLRELGLEACMQWRQTATGFYQAGRAYPFTTPADFARFPVLTPIEKLRLGWTILRASRLQDWRALEDLTVEQWLTGLSGASVFRKIWKPLLLAKLGEEYRHTSATFIWATIQRMYAARRQGNRSELFGYLPGGYARFFGVLETRLAQLGVRVQVRAGVQSVRVNECGELAVHLLDGSSLAAERVILTTPSGVAASLCPQLPTAERAAHQAISYLGILCASVVLRRPLSPYYITNILDPQIPFTGLIEMSALVDRQEFLGHSLLYIPRYVHPDHADFERSDGDVESEMLQALYRMYPQLQPSDVVAFRLSRARHVFARPGLGYSRTLPPIDSALAGLSIVNSAQILNGTLNANETIDLAQKEAERLHALPTLETRRQFVA